MINRKDIWIILQGPLDYYKEVIPYYKNLDNVIISTWVSEKEKIENKKHCILSYPPIVSGKHNINYQVKSTLAGLKYAKKQGAEYVFKIRADIAFDDLELLISKLKFDNTLYFPAYYNSKEGYLVDYFQFGPIDKMIKLWDIPLKFEIFNKKYPEYYITKNFLKKLPEEKIRYLIPILIENGMKYTWFKNLDNFSQILQIKDFVYDKYLKI